LSNGEDPQVTHHVSPCCVWESAYLSCPGPSTTGELHRRDESECEAGGRLSDVKEELDVSFGTFDRRGHLTDHPARRLGFDEGAKLPKDRFAIGLALDDAVRRELLLPDLELRLDEGEEFGEGRFTS